MLAVQRNETMRIGGQNVSGDAGSSEVFNPYNNEIVGTVPRASREQVQQTLQIAQDFKPKLTRYERQQILTKTADLLVARRDEISDLIPTEPGISKKDSLYEVGRAFDVFSLAGQLCILDDGQIFSCDLTPHGQKRKIFTQREPLQGVISAITPFNHPLNMVAHKIAPSIATNNRMVCKPTELTPMTALLLADVLYEAGLPPEMFQVVTGRPEDIGDEMIHDHLIRKVREDDLETFKLMRSTGIKYSQLSEEQRRYSVTSKAFREGKQVKQNQKMSFGDKYNILKPNEPCLTITAHMSKDGYWYIHPHQNRTLSVREAARVQSFPDGFNFYGGPSNRFHQIGEAVAPIVAFELGKSFMKSIKNEKEFTQPDVVPKLRENLINWYESNKKEVELIWTKKREGRKIIPSNIRAWNACLGNLLPETFKKNTKEKNKPAILGDKDLEKRKKDTYQRLKNFWPAPEIFLQDKARKMKIKSFSLEKYIPSLELIAEELIKDEIDWSEITRKEYNLFSRNSV